AYVAATLMPPIGFKRQRRLFRVTMPLSNRRGLPFSSGHRPILHVSTSLLHVNGVCLLLPASELAIRRFRCGKRIVARALPPGRRSGIWPFSMSMLARSTRRLSCLRPVLRAREPPSRTCALPSIVASRFLARKYASHARAQKLQKFFLQSI